MTLSLELKPTERSSNTSVEEINRLYFVQQAHIADMRLSPIEYRIKKLYQLRSEILTHRPEIRKALYDDFQKPGVEVDMAEIFPLLNEIKHTIKKLRKWTQPHRVGTPWYLLGSSSHIQYEPKGHCLIVAPWNFPIHLTLMPLIHSFAAGNVNLIKPSEFTPFSVQVVKKLITRVFDENEVAVVEGDVSVATYITSLRFNHIFFTGSPGVGKIIMKAAAQHLCSVTLELGGKSPLIIDRSADIEMAGVCTAVVKLINAGQHCISPDHIYVHESIQSQFEKELINQIRSRFGTDKDSLMKGDYCRMVNHRHTQRALDLMQDALSKGATLLYHIENENEQDFIGPMVFKNVQEDMALCNEEIFGPLTYIRSFQNIETVIRTINAGEKPLALYLFTKDRAIMKKIKQEVPAGGMCINAIASNYYNYNLPFGGVNHSGMGKSHGFHSFVEFSNAKSVFYQWSPWPTVNLFFPPFTKRTKKLVDLFLKFF